MAMQKLMKAADLETHGAALRVAPVAVHGSSVEKWFHRGAGFFSRSRLVGPVRTASDPQ